MVVSEKKVRVLMMTSGFQKGTSGGVAAFCFNYFQEMDKTKFSFDFLTIAYQAFDLYREKIESQGGILYCLNVRSFRGLRGKMAYVKAFKRFLEEHTYDVIHVNMGSFYTVFLCSLIAKKYGKNAKVIAHSHSTLVYRGINYLAVRCTKPFFPMVSDWFLACSKVAGEYMFPNKVVNGKKYRVLNNAIKAEHFQFDPKIRATIRASFGIKDQLLVGHVGRFAHAKNHSFLIDVFAAILKKREDALLMLVGAGDLEREIRNKIEASNLVKQVIFTGLRSDVPQLIQAMDVMVMPSLFEGFPVVSVEAQASGLPVLISSSVTNETQLTEAYSRLSLEESPDRWAEEALELVDTNVRKSQLKAVVDAGFDIGEEAKKLGDLYIELVQSEGTGL
jgi:glycosyltransferase involved in cell wall biosynthesis